MTLRTAPSTSPTRPVRDPALDDALEHIGELSERLWAVRRLHAPVRTRTLLGAVSVRCGACAQPSPCPTLLAVAPRGAAAAAA